MWVLVILKVGGGALLSAGSLYGCTNAGAQLLAQARPADLTEAYCIQANGDPERVYVVRNGKAERLE